METPEITITSQQIRDQIKSKILEYEKPEDRARKLTEQIYVWPDEEKRAILQLAYDEITINGDPKEKDQHIYILASIHNALKDLETRTSSV